LQSLGRAWHQREILSALIFASESKLRIDSIVDL
jgi:hypothetical protein